MKICKMPSGLFGLGGFLMVVLGIFYGYFYNGLNMKNNILISLALGMCFGSIAYSFYPVRPDPEAVEKPIIVPPAIGSLWEIKSGDPFPSSGAIIKILEIKEGWVRFYVCPTMPDERCTYNVFRTTYRPRH